MKTRLGRGLGVLLLTAMTGYSENAKAPDKNAAELLGNPEYPAISYGGYRQNTRDVQPSVEELKEDMRILAAMGIKIVRTYNVTFQHAPNVLKAIRELKAEDPGFEMYVMLGAWIDCHNAWTDQPLNHEAESEANAAEIDRAAALAKTYPDIVKIIAVGNEAMVHWQERYFVRPDVILKWVNHLQALKKQGVLSKDLWITCSDDFSSWGGGDPVYHTPDLEKLIHAVDYISMHTYPMHNTYYNPDFWVVPEEERALSDAEKIEAAMLRAKAFATNQYHAVCKYVESLGVVKPVHIGETGWATVSNGHYGPDQSRAADEYKSGVYYQYMREWTRESKITCFYFIAFDECWKDAGNANGSENHFGLINLKGEAKYALWDLVDRGAFDGLTRDGHPITKTFNGDRKALMETVLAPPAAVKMGAHTEDKGIKISARHILVNDVPYQIRGVCYHPVPKGKEARDFGNLAEDLALMKEAGVNTIRVYVPIDDKAVLDEIHAAGLKLIVGFGYNQGGIFDILSGSFIDYVNTYKNHDAILMWELGNEYNYHPEWFEGDVRIWYAALNHAAEMIHQNDPSHPVTTAHGELPDALALSSCPHVDVWGMNVYRWDHPEDIFSEWKRVSSRPMYLSEAGADSYMTASNHGYKRGVNEKAQADANQNILNDIFKHRDVCSGVALYSFVDEWWKAGNPDAQDPGGHAPNSGGVPYDGAANEEYWGMVDIDRNKKATFNVVKDMYTAIEKAETSRVEIRRTGQRFQLWKDGKPYFIKGAGGSKYMDELVEAGGNSIRTWSSSKAVLDAAQKNGLTVCVGLRLLLPRQGADYQDTKMLMEQRDRISDAVMELKDHPAILMWGIGNEVEHQTDREEAVLVWKEMEIIARRIKEIDPNHPVITVIAGTGEKLADIQQLCPTLDALGINSYGQLGKVPAELKRYGWKKPYIITEFGPRGWWEVERTAWGLPIEDTSTEKAQFYYKAYKAAIDNQPNCLGSYVFFWDNKQEKTHTWFNLFLEDGTPTEIVDTMSLLWTGEWPGNRGPRIGNKKIYVEGRDTRHIYKASSKVVFRAQADDPDGDALTIKWDLRRDESDNPSTGGDWEQRIPPIEEAILSSAADSVRIQMPARPGNYRLFAYVYDPSGKVATANLPIQVESAE